MDGAGRLGARGFRLWVGVGLALVATFCVWLALIRLRGQTSFESTVVGYVVDDDGPVAHASVRVKGDTEATFSDASGEFTLLGKFDSQDRVTAAKEGYFIRSTPVEASPVRIRLARLPRYDTESYAWIDPRPDRAAKLNCANCHEQMYQEWRASGHANSVKNRRFLSLYDGSDWRGRENVGWNLMSDFPIGVGVCSTCHGPSLEFDDAAFHDLRLATGVAALGVHCDFCHKVREVNIPSPGLTHGRDGLSLLRPEEGQVFLGPRDDVDTGDAAFAPVYQKSVFCASCHEGIVFGVHVYSTYSEWLGSSAAKSGQSCQSCHMAPTGDMTNAAPGNGGIERDPATLASHCDLGSRRDRLRASVDIDLQIESRGADVCAVVIVGTRDVGHDVPTGFIDRNLTLVVDARDENGERTALQSGPILPAIAGSLAGSPGRLYAKQTLDFDGASPVPFWRAQPDVIDTRLRPDRKDRVQFVFAGSPKRLRIRLIYRRFWEEVAVVKKWPSDEIVIMDKTWSVEE